MSENVTAFSFDLNGIIINAVVSAIILFVIGVITKRKLGFNLGRVISFIKCFCVFVVPYIVFWISHQTPSFQAITDYMFFIFNYLPIWFGAVIGMVIGDMVGAIGQTAEQEFLSYR
ncbi:MAG: hypothetical protein ACQCN3_12515 [Candidatus Bathyarchaeia archaeon]|jgi:tetrahydromethanopterin S-methyltransferase subunit C